VKPEWQYVPCFSKIVQGKRKRIITLKQDKQAYKVLPPSPDQTPKKIKNKRKTSSSFLGNSDELGFSREITKHLKGRGLITPQIKGNIGSWPKM